MKPGKVIMLSEYRAQRQTGTRPEATSSASRALPDADHLRELLDRNISLRIWKKGS
jgi:hypothetical protein